MLDFLKKEEKENVPVVKKAPSPKTKKAELVHSALLSPHVTEKATDLNAENKYIFKIYPKANKIEVKKAIESTYGVNVIGVNIINIPRKKRRVGKSAGWKKGYKKAVIKIKKGQKIEILSH